MFCPNCGDYQKSDSVSECPKCSMPLAPVAEKVAEHKREGKEVVKPAGIPKEKLIGAGAFLAIALVPIGLGVKNSLQGQSR